MNVILKFTFAIICCLSAFYNVVESQNLIDEMKDILDNYDTESKLLCNRNVKANWDVATDQENEALKVVQEQIILEYAAFRSKQYEDNFKDANIADYAGDADVQRKLKLLKDIGTSILDDTKLSQLTTVKNAMSKIYNTAKICPFAIPTCNLTTEGLSLDPEIENLLASSENYDELLWIWEQWHEKSGKEMRNDYKAYVDLMNEAAVANKYADAGAMWRNRYEYPEDNQLIVKVDQLWQQVEPLYDELHKYVHREIKKLYGDKIDSSSKNIPAHLLGNMWAQSWINLYDRIKPFKDASLVDVTSAMNAKGYDAVKMFEMSDEFYQSMGLPNSTMSYTGESVIVKPDDREIQCHASAWDFCDGEDFRIKMCTKVNMEDFITVHHEMGHIMYYLMYKDQPLIYRTGANPGFHEAVGDTIALSVSTPTHLKKIGLLENYADSEADNINALFYMALERVAFLPFGLLIDKWRWEVFSGAVTEDKWNERWWQLREQYQKVSPPSNRDETFFDPGAKFHVPGDSQYIAYFVAHILEFSFYKSLCIEAGQYDPNDAAKPLHKCDFYQSKEAGAKLEAGLNIGFSQHWSKALEELTGETDINASAILEYFKPLYDFLKSENMKKDHLDPYNEAAAIEMNKFVEAQWAVATDTESQEKQAALSLAVSEHAAFDKKWYNEVFKGEKPEDYADESVKRQLKFLTKLGTSVLDDSDLTELTETQMGMENTYNTAKICPFDKQNCNLATEGLTLDPEISEVMSKSEKFDELKWAWEQWHEKSGKSMRDGYKKYIELNNKAAKENGYKDYGDMWRDAYEDEKFIENVDNMWKEVEPLYNELHTYVKRKLEKIYSEMDTESETIPAHLLGNMWAQSWVNLYERIKPFGDGSSIDIQGKLKEYSVKQMFEVSDKFFKDLGLEPNEMSYTGKSVIEKPNITITCHASAWDFYMNSDFRIKMCTSVNQEDFITVHHEMGHIQYFILYKDQPVVLRGGAHPGFHEAVGDLIALSVSTPTHLKKIGLLVDYEDSEADNINALFKMALERVAFLPFGLLIDKWRWDVFSGDVKETEWNKHWWELREKYQKVSPPSARNETFFDPGAKYHIPADSQYIAYFTAHMLEFQMHRALCKEIGQYDPDDDKKPLHKCDIDGNKTAGTMIRNGLKLGMSKHWSEALKAMTGEEKISGQAVVDYFKPLYDFLKEENAKDGVGHLLPGLKTIFLTVAASIFVAFKRF
jgi:peptidyl-dipeptidase A